MCLAQEHNAVTPVRVEPVATLSRVKHSTFDPLRSLRASGAVVTLDLAKGRTSDIIFTSELLAKYRTSDLICTSELLAKDSTI